MTKREWAKAWDALEFQVMDSIALSRGDRCLRWINLAWYALRGSK
jgi:hypothetical protein